MKAALSKVVITALVFSLSVSYLGENQAHASQTISINKNTVHQTIDGIGTAANHPVDLVKKHFSAADQNAIMDLLYGENGLDLSIVRLEINPFLKSDSTSINALQATFWPTENGALDWDTDHHQRWWMNEAMKRGHRRVISLPWSPPAWMKTNNSAVSGGTLLSNKYNAFANYLETYTMQYSNVFGIPVDYISLQNEPDYSTSYASAVYTGSEMSTLINTVADHFSTKSLWPKIFAPEASSGKKSNDDYMAVLDTTTRNKLYGIAYHNYSGYSSTLENYGLPVWMTEDSNLGTNDATITDGIKWAKAAHTSLVTRKNNAWLFWLSVLKKTSGESLINIEETNGVYTYFVNKRAYTIGQFSRFVRPGFKRIGSSSSTSSLKVASFKDPANDKAVIVVINDSTSTDHATTISGLTATNAKLYRTSATENMIALSDAAVSGGSFTHTFPKNSVTTIVEDIGSAGAPAAISDLSGANSSLGVKLTWTAPGSSSIGRGDVYELRMSNSPITSSNYSSALLVGGVPSPLDSGTAQSYLLSGLTSGKTYYFAMKTKNKAGQWSGISNVASNTTNAGVSTLFHDGFEDMNANNWTTSGSGFSVVYDGNSYRYQVSNSSGTSIATSGDTSWTNYTVEAKVKASSLASDAGAPSLLARYTNANNYYRFGFSKSNNDWRLWKRVGGTQTMIKDGPAFTFNLDTEYKLKLEVNGSTLKLWVDSGNGYVEQFTHTDASLTNGSIGVHVFKGTATYDDLTVSGL